jgi:RNA-binding protein
MNLMLTNHQKNYLKGLAHSKKPVVTIGNKGLSASVIEELRLAMEHHELIKIKLPADGKTGRLQLLEAICKQCDATLITLIGRTGVVFKQVESGKIKLPK